MRMMMPVPGDRAATSETRDDFGASPLRAQRRARRAWSPRVAMERERLAVSEPGDASEREADAAAQRLVAGLPARVTPLARAPVQRRCAACEGASAAPCARCQGREEEELPTAQRRATATSAVDSAAPVVPPGGGSPLPGEVQTSFGALLGVDLSGVRVHAGAEAARSADRLSAEAYTVGDDVVFAAGQYALGTPRGRELLAHELAHVAQQRSGQRLILRQALGAQRHGRGQEIEVPTASFSPTSASVQFATSPSVARGLRLLARTRVRELNAALSAADAMPTRLVAGDAVAADMSLIDLTGEVWLVTRRHVIRLDREGHIAEGQWLYDVNAHSLEPGATYVYADLQRVTETGSQQPFGSLVRVHGVPEIVVGEVQARTRVGDVRPLARSGQVALRRGHVIGVITPDREASALSGTTDPTRIFTAFRMAADRVPWAAGQLYERLRAHPAAFSVEQIVGFAQGVLLDAVPPIGTVTLAMQLAEEVAPLMALAGNATSPNEEMEFAAQGLARFAVETVTGIVVGAAAARVGRRVARSAFAARVRTLWQQRGLGGRPRATGSGRSSNTRHVRPELGQASDRLAWGDFNVTMSRRYGLARLLPEDRSLAHRIFRLIRHTIDLSRWSNMSDRAQQELLQVMLQSMMELMGIPEPMRARLEFDYSRRGGSEMNWSADDMSGTIRIWMSGGVGQIVARLIHEARHYHQEWHIRLFLTGRGGAHPNAGEWHRNSRDYRMPPEDGAVMSDHDRSEAMASYREQITEADAETFTRSVMSWLSGMNL